MTNPIPDADALRRLLGKTVLHKTHRYKVIEVLDQELALVLESLDQTLMQSDLHGRANRPMPKQTTIMALDDSGQRPSNDLMALRIID